jgi:hypothetical protein
MGRRDWGSAVWSEMVRRFSFLLLSSSLPRALPFFLSFLHLPCFIFFFSVSLQLGAWVDYGGWELVWLPWY